MEEIYTGKFMVHLIEQPKDIGANKKLWKIT